MRRLDGDEIRNADERQAILTWAMSYCQRHNGCKGCGLYPSCTKMNNWPLEELRAMYARVHEKEKIVADRDLICMEIDREVDAEEDLRKTAKVKSKEDKHSMIVHELHDIYCRKNHDYGDSFSALYNKYGMIYPVIHIEEKLNRIRTLMESSADVSESMRDSLLDLANYCILTVMERDR